MSYESYDKLKGIIIREVNYGESDKILTVLTEEEGKITISAKGARRNKSGICAASSIMCYSEFTLYKGKSMYILNGIDIIEQFYNIRNDLDSLTYASYFLEVVNDVVPEHQSANDVLKLLLNCLFFIMKNKKSKLLIKIIFDFRLMAIIGYAPSVNECQVCNCKKELNYFSYSICGLICEDCIKGKEHEHSTYISKGSILALNHILSSKINDLFSFNVSNYVLIELKKISKQYIKDRMEKNYKTINLLDKIANSE